MTPPSGIIEDADPAWTWSGMTEVADPQYHGGTAHAGRKGTYGVYTFHGTSLTISGFAGRAALIDGHARRIGSATVTIDDKRAGTVILSDGDDDYRHVLYQVSGLAEGNHVVKVEAASDWIIIDYIATSSAAAGKTEKDQSGGKLYRLYSKYPANQYLETATVMLDDAATIKVSPSNSARSQVWRVVSVGNGSFRISPDNAPDQAMTLSTTTLFDGPTKLNPIVIKKYVGAPEQKWTITPMNGPWYRIALSSNPQMHVNIWVRDKYVVGYQQTGNDVPENELWTFESVDH